MNSKDIRADLRVAAHRLSPLAGPFFAFALVHVVLSWVNLGYTAFPMLWDVTTAYRGWSDEWYQHGVLVGIDAPWVYPVLAVLPMLAAGLGQGDGYGASWLVLVSVLDLAVLIPLGLRSRAAAWWWVAFTALLGPIALGRIDAVALPIAVLGVLLLSRRPAIAALLLTVATWVKVWPAGILLALVTHVRRVRILVFAAAASALITVLALALGAGTNIASPITAQSGRGIQIESPAALPWMWAAHFRPDLASVYFDNDLITYQVAGPGVGLAASLMTPLLGAVCGLLLILGWLTSRRSTEPTAVLAITAMGLVAALVAFNKVGSPQYMTWLAAPVILGLIESPRLFRLPAVGVVIAAALTQLIFPWAYNDIIATTAPMLVVLTARNMIEIAVVLWAMGALHAEWRAHAPLVGARDVEMRRPIRSASRGALASR